MRRTRHASSDRSYYRVKFAVKYSVLTLISSARLLYEKIQKYIILLHYYCTVCTHDEYIIARDLCARYVRCTCNYSGKKKKRNDLPNDLYRTGFSNWIEQPCGTAGKRAIICGVSLKKTNVHYFWRTRDETSINFTLFFFCDYRFSRYRHDAHAAARQMALWFTTLTVGSWKHSKRKNPGTEKSIESSPLRRHRNTRRVTRKMKKLQKMNIAQYYYVRHVTGSSYSLSPYKTHAAWLVLQY